MLSLADVISTKVRALFDRGAVRDLIDVHVASRHRTTAGLKALDRRHARIEFDLHDLHDLRDRLNGAERYEDEEFTAYGLTSEETTDLRTWALTWAADLDSRLHRNSYDG